VQRTAAIESKLDRFSTKNVMTSGSGPRASGLHLRFEHRTRFFHLFAAQDDAIHPYSRSSEVPGLGKRSRSGPLSKGGARGRFIGLVLAYPKGRLRFWLPGPAGRWHIVCRSSDEVCGSRLRGGEGRPDPAFAECFSGVAL
jgi:hypothetical protein